METKSRYEIIAELEGKKTKLLSGKAGIGLQSSMLARDVEKAQDALKEYEDQKDIQIQNIDDQLESIERSLDRLNTQKK